MLTNKFVVVFLISLLMSCGGGTFTPEEEKEGNEEDKTQSYLPAEIHISIVGYGGSQIPTIAEDDDIATKGLALINQYCLGCHSDDQTGLDLSVLPFKSQMSSEDLQLEIIRRLRLDANDSELMPPNSITLRPLPEELDQMAEWASLGFPAPINTEENALVLAKVDTFNDEQVVASHEFESLEFSVQPENATSLKISVRDGDTWSVVSTLSGTYAQTSFVIDASPNSLSPQYLNAMIRNYDVTTVEDFISKLPYEYLNNFAMMRESQSRHIATLQYPRVISYGYDASLILGISTNPDDPKHQEVELVFLDDEGQWSFHLIDFSSDNPEFTDSTATCTGCHGDPARPIWGAYPDWPGAIGDSVPGKVVLNLEEKQMYESIREDSSINLRLAIFPYKIYDYSLEMDSGINEHDLVLFNSRLSARQSESIFARLSQERLDHWGDHLLHNQICQGIDPVLDDQIETMIDTQYRLISDGAFSTYYRSVPKLIELMGLNSKVELSLTQIADAIDVTHSDFSDQGWFAGEESIPMQTAFLILRQSIQKNEERKALLSDEMLAELNELYYYSWEVKGKLRRPAIESRSQLDYGEYFFSNFFDDLASNSTLCTQLLDELAP